MRFKKTLLMALVLLSTVAVLPQTSASETVHVSFRNLSGNGYFSIDTNSWNAGQRYSAGCGATTPVAHPNGTRIYTATACQFGAGFLSVFNTIHVPPTAIKVLPLTNNAWGLDINPTGTKVYIADFNGNQILVLDTASNTYDAPIPVGTQPYSIKVAPNGQFAYVSHYAAGTIWKINLNNNTVVGDPILSGPGAFEIAFSPNGSTAFVTNNSTHSPGTVTVIDVATGAGTKVIAVGNTPTGIAMLPSGNKAYVANLYTHTVSVISTEADTCLEPIEEPPCLSATISTSTNPVDIAITADGSFAYVTNNGSESVQVIDTGTDTISQTVSLNYNPDSEPWGIAISPPPDSDNDGHVDSTDNCPNIANPSQENYDFDSFGDVCDPDDDNDGQTDIDEIACGSLTMNSSSLSPDHDGDFSPDCVDEDDDNDGQSDSDELACGSSPTNKSDLSPDLDEDDSPDCVDEDIDGDGVNNNEPDNCPSDHNPLQLDDDGDDTGNVCDPDLAADSLVTTASGGTVETGNVAVTLSFEPGDVSSDTQVSISGTDISGDANLELNSGGAYGEVLAAYKFEPDGIDFNAPVSLSMTVDVTALNPEQRAQLDIYFRDSNGIFSPLGAVCLIAEGPPGTFIATCTADIMHFSIYALIAPLDSDGDGVFDYFMGEEDNCPNDDNPDQSDLDDNGYGDVCDPEYIFHSGFESQT